MQVDQRLFELVTVAVLRDVFLAEARHAEDVEDEDAVVRDDRAPALRDDRRMLHARLVAHVWMW